MTMSPRSVLVGSLALACIVAAGAGAYFASLRSPATQETGIAEAPVPVAAQTAAAPQAQPAPEAGTVVTVDEPTETEVEKAAAPMVVEQPAAPKAPSRRERPAEASRRQQVERPTPTRAPIQAPVAARTAPPAEPNVTFVPAITPPVVESNPQEPAPPAKVYQELVIAPDSVIGLQLDTSVNSETAQVEDRVEARVTRDVKVDGDIAVPAGARAMGSVTQVEQGGKIKERARLGIRFRTLVLADGTQVPIRTDAIYREGDSPASKSTAKIGGAAVAGTILGAILGGKKGAVIGGAVGAAGGTAATMAGGRSTAELPAGTSLTVRISEPVTVVVEK